MLLKLRLIQCQKLIFCNCLVVSINSFTFIVCSYFLTFVYSDLYLQFSDISCPLRDGRITSSAFIMHELEEECRDRNLQWSFVGTKDESIDNLMAKIEKRRSSELYVHTTRKIARNCAKLKGLNMFIYLCTVKILMKKIGYLVIYEVTNPILFHLVILLYFGIEHTVHMILNTLLIYLI